MLGAITGTGSVILKVLDLFLILRLPLEGVGRVLSGYVRSGRSGLGWCRFQCVGGNGMDGVGNVCGTRESISDGVTDGHGLRALFAGFLGASAELFGPMLLG